MTKHKKRRSNQKIVRNLYKQNTNLLLSMDLVNPSFLPRTVITRNKLYQEIADLKRGIDVHYTIKETIQLNIRIINAKTTTERT